MTTTAEHLGQYGVSMEAANAFVMGNLDQLAFILLTARAYGVTTAMLGEIVGWPWGPISAEIVQDYCADQGYDASLLDRAPGQVGVLSVSDGSATEGSDVVFHVTLSGPTTQPLSMDAVFSGGNATKNVDYGAATATNGVTLTGNGGINIPAGVSSFDIHVPTLQDTSVEGNEHFSLFIGAFSPQGEIVDDDQGGGGSSPTVTLVGDPTATEGTDLVYLVNLSAATTSDTGFLISVGGGSASASDFGTPTFTNGVWLRSPTTITVPAGVDSFVIHVPTVNDSEKEAFETVLVTLTGTAGGSFTGTGYIADND